jgi:hypothetical protein
MITFKNVLVILLLTLTSSVRTKLRQNGPNKLAFRSKITENCLTLKNDNLKLVDCEAAEKLELEENSLKLKKNNSCPKIHDQDSNSVEVEDCANAWEIAQLGDYVTIQVKTKGGNVLCVTAASMEDVMVTHCEHGNEDQLFEKL